VNMKTEFVDDVARARVLRYIQRRGVALDDDPGWRFTTFHNVGRQKFQHEVYIYGLADPRDHVIRYVGKTSKTLLRRVLGHMEEPTNTRMAEWVSSLIDADVTMEAVALEICSPESWEKAERKWIARLRRVGSLLNVDRGGIRGSKRGPKGNYRGARTVAGPVRVLDRAEIAKMEAAKAMPLAKPQLR
jgi:hypothetical protein